MTGRRHEGDLLVLGYSLEAALAAALVARAGGKVLWLGGVPTPTISIGKHKLPAAPSLMPSLTQTPTLARVLREVGILADVQRALAPISLQFLGDRRRISSAEDWLKQPQAPTVLEALQETAAVAAQISEQPPTLGYFGRRRFATRRTTNDARLTAPTGVVGEATSLLDQVFSREKGSQRSTLQTIAAPSDLPGGTLALGHMLQRKCVELGTRLFPEDLSKRLMDFKVSWGGIEGRLASGEAISAKVALVALDEGTAEQVLPPASPLLPKMRVPAGDGLLQLSLIVRRRGLPEALGTMALIADSQALWLEHRAISVELAGLSLFWRPFQGDPQREAEWALAALDRVAPFFQRHLVERSAVERVPDQNRGSVYARPVLTRRLIAARGPLFGLDGAEGSALSATALAERCLRLAPPPKAAAA